MKQTANQTLQHQKTLTLPDEFYELLCQGKQISIQLEDQHVIFQAIESPTTVAEEKNSYSIDSKSYAERTQEHTFNDLLHEGKQRAYQRLEDQGISSMALYISEMMVQSLEAERQHSQTK